jgi:hypothetical protein
MRSVIAFSFERFQEKLIDFSGSETRQNKDLERFQEKLQTFAVRKRHKTKD